MTTNPKHPTNNKAPLSGASHIGTNGALNLLYARPANTTRAPITFAHNGNQWPPTSTSTQGNTTARASCTKAYRAKPYGARFCPQAPGPNGSLASRAASVPPP
jgi:hypothetical protein